MATAPWRKLAADLRTCSQRSWWKRLRRLVAALESDPAVRPLLPEEPQQPGDPGFLWSYDDAPIGASDHARLAYRAIKFFIQDDVSSRVGAFSPHSHPLYQVREGDRWQPAAWEDRRNSMLECWVDPLVELVAGHANPAQPSHGSAPQLHLRLLEIDDTLREEEARSRPVTVRYVKSIHARHVGTFRKALPGGTDTLVLEVGETATVQAEIAAALLSDHGDAFEVACGHLPALPVDRGKPFITAAEAEELRKERARLRAVLGLD